MASLEAPSFQEETGRRKMFDFNRGILYWQGLLPDGPDTDLQYLSPRLARIVVRHPPLRQALRSFRSFYPWFMIGNMSLSCFVVHPLGINKYWGNELEVIDNVFPMVVWFSIIVGTSTFTLKKAKCNGMITKLEELSREENLDNDYQRELMKKTNTRGFNMTRNSQIIVDSVGICAVTIVTVTGFLPQRKLYFKSCFPYDEYETPFYEITLALFCLQIVCGFLFANAYLTSVVSFFIHLRVLFMILANKFLNIKEIAVERIQNRKRQQHMPSAITSSLYVREQNGGEMKESVQKVGGYGSNRELKLVINTMVHNPKPPSNLTWFEVTRSYTIRQTGQDRTKQLSDVDKEVDQEMKYLLKKFVELHQELLIFKNDLHSVCKLYLMSLSALNVCLFGTTLILLSAHDELELYEMLILLISFEFIIMFLLLNLLCDFITNEAKAVGEAVYFSDWFDCSLSCKHSMINIMVLTNKPLFFKSTGMDPFSLKYFGEVSNLAYKTTATMKGLVN